MNELDNGRVVFFCGAGISAGQGSDLPNFADLLAHVYAVNHLGPDAFEKEALDLEEQAPERRRPNFDRALGLLERRERLGAQILRRTVIDRLSKPPTGPLRTHKALIALSRIEHGVRLITTNFDNRFVQAGLEEQIVDVSPKLPVPKPHNWSTLVHLHGRIFPGDDGANLVLTAADFGRAYLTERWAARFNTELFREFTVVFVGYSVSDPVMSYMVDALAAERTKGARFTTAYAFADYDAPRSSRQRVRDGWLAKNVEPILYNKEGDHKLLSDTLVEWARLRTDPYQARTQIALNEISKLPAGSNNAVVERVTWALQDPVAAQALADAPPVSDESDFPKIEQWLEVFAKKGLLSSPVADVDPHSTNPNGPIVHLVDSGASSQNPPDLDSVRFQLARWISCHLHVPQLLAWVLGNGGQMHPVLRREVRRELANADIEIPPKFRHLWCILLDSEFTDPWRFVWTSKQVKVSSESERRRIEEQVIKSIAPRLVVRPGPSPRLRFLQDYYKKPKPIRPIDACGHVKLLVSDADTRHQVFQIVDDTNILSRNAETLTGYLDHALRLGADDDNVSSNSFLYRPSIAAHDQNRDRDHWTRLIDLVRDSYFALVSTDPAHADNLLRRWVLSREPLFKRLALHALTENFKSDVHLVRKLLIAGRKTGLWDIELRQEVLRLFRSAGSRLPRSLRTEIVRTIHAGPKTKPKKLRPNYPEIIRREKALLLYNLAFSGATLDKKSRALADEGKPPAEDHFDERDEFLSWIGEGSLVDQKDFAPKNLLSGSIADLVTALTNTQITPDGFHGLSIKQPSKSAFALRCLARRQDWPDTYWQRFLWAITHSQKQERKNARLHWYVACVLTNAPAELLKNVGSAIATFVKQLADASGIDRETKLKTLWERAWIASDQSEEMDSDDPLMEALNDTHGQLAEAALLRLWKYEPRTGEGLPPSVRSYFEKITADPDGHFGRVMLATRLHQLFSIDRDWVVKHLIPLFNPRGSEEANNLWAAYAWSPTVGPDLLSAFKESFLEILASEEGPAFREGNLIRLFMSICLESPNELRDEEIRNVVESLSEESLKTVLDSLKHRLKGDARERAVAWNNKVGPWLQKYWPQVATHSTAGTSETMLAMLVECGDAFPDAGTWSLPYLRPIEGYSLHDLKESGHIGRNREVTLQILEKVVGDDTLQRGLRYILREILDALKDSEPELVSKPRFQRLYKIATA